MHKKKGDTLIEVALAIGIFSLVAIVIVSVVSASTSGAQSALEVTLTREDMDAQAEALRFIHDSYVTGSQSANTGDNPYANLWNNIVSRATSASVNLAYNPATCSELYDPNGYMKDYVSKKQFVINTRKLGNPNDVDGIVVAVRPSNSTGPFYEAKTYPRIIYGDSYGSASTNEDLYNQTEISSTSIQRVEGLFVVAIRGDNSNIVTGSTVSSGVAYYDFYIRSCWTPPNADRASTISTVVRLYDPAVVH